MSHIGFYIIRFGADEEVDEKTTLLEEIQELREEEDREKREKEEKKVKHEQLEKDIRKRALECLTPKKGMFMCK